MIVLALSTALPEVVIGLVDGGAGGGSVLREATLEGGPGLAARCPQAVSALLSELDEAPALIACSVGPGSFTGLRIGLSLAHGLCLGFSCRLAGVTSREAVLHGSDEVAGGTLWVATLARRGRLFLETGPASPVTLAEDDVSGLQEGPSGRLWIAGDGAEALGAMLRARGSAFSVVSPALPGILGIARAGQARASGALPARSALPLYVEQAEVSRPSQAPRPLPLM